MSTSPEVTDFRSRVLLGDTSEGSANKEKAGATDLNAHPRTPNCQARSPTRHQRSVRGDFGFRSFSTSPYLAQKGVVNDKRGFFFQKVRRCSPVFLQLHFTQAWRRFVAIGSILGLQLCLVWSLAPNVLIYASKP